jgi:hypothetical protein
VVVLLRVTSGDAAHSNDKLRLVASANIMFKPVKRLEQGGEIRSCGPGKLSTPGRLFYSEDASEQSE